MYFSAIMEPTKNAGSHWKITLWCPVAAKNNAGPGHKSARAQPIPKMADPATRLVSTLLFVGTKNSSALMGQVNLLP